MKQITDQTKEAMGTESIDARSVVLEYVQPWYQINEIEVQCEMNYEVR
jgi:hypothetical protein